MSVRYATLMEQICDTIGHLMTSHSWALLCLVAADQAGLSIHQQAKIADVLNSRFDDLKVIDVG